MEGWRGSKLSKRSIMEERESAKSWVPIGEEGPLNRCPENPTVGGRIPQGRYYRPSRFSRPTAREKSRSSGTAAGGDGTAADGSQRALLAALLAVPPAVLPPEVAVLPLNRENQQNPETK